MSNRRGQAAKHRMYSVYFQSERHNIQFLAPLSVIPCFNLLCVARLCLVLCRLPLGPAIQPSTSQLKPIVEQCLDSMCLLMSSLLIEVLAQRQHIHPWAGAALVVLASMKASSESRSQKNFWPGIALLYLTQKHLSGDARKSIHLSNRNTELISILCIFNIEMSVGTMFLHVPFDVSPKHLLFTIRTGSILVFSQVLKSDVPFAVGLVGEGSFTSEAGKSPIVLTQTKLVCCLQQSRCKRVIFHGEF